MGGLDGTRIQGRIIRLDGSLPDGGIRGDSWDGDGILLRGSDHTKRNSETVFWSDIGKNSVGLILAGDNCGISF
ncbi:MAG: hypothetical protein RBG13Loki_1297 [Promethearchaeota archaeon CR_4]|nr:MAG: hypothetical protein RBG13Loki_1297 [Candidatus Lokiarchaeota archaeon CR_4]